MKPLPYITLQTPTPYPLELVTTYHLNTRHRTLKDSSGMLGASQKEKGTAILLLLLKEVALST